MNYKLNEVLEKLQSAGYLYKGKTITKRTIRTMLDRGKFETSTKCEGGNCWLVSVDEINNMISRTGNE